MEFIQQTQSLITDAFITLPLLLIGFTFFFGTLTSNIGMLYLFLGHLLIVPMTSYLQNEEGRPWMENGLINFIKLIKYIVSLITVFTVTYVPGSSDDGFTLAKYILFPIAGLAHILWMNFSPVSSTSTSNCAVIPGLAEGDRIYNHPSSWLNHVTFFISYVFANALSIFNQPTPSLPQSSDPNQNADRQAKLDTRVRNRKWLSTGIMMSIVVIFSILLAFRFFKTPCESGFVRSLLPLFLTGSLGFSWFEFVYEKCGVRPADVLGIVQGFISPELIDNPVVCVGS